MARYADIDKLIWQVQNNDKYGTITKQMFISLLQNSETEDVAPVIHAHWIDYGEGVECSHCEWYARFETHYCPDCGAKMDEVAVNNG